MRLLPWLVHLVLVRGVRSLTGVSLDFFPAVVGVPAAITLTFTTEDVIATNEYITVGLAGFTSGSRGNTVGADISDGTNLELELEPSATFGAFYTEGTVEEEFADSVLSIKILSSLSSGVTYTVSLDASSGLVSNCGHPADFELFTWKVSEATYASSAYASGGVSVAQQILSTTAIPQEEYASSTAMTAMPPRPKVSLGLEFTFTPARHLYTGDTITFAMPGFTVGSAEETAGADKALTSVEPSATYSAAWTEGTYVKDSSGYTASAITLTLLATVEAGSLETITFLRSDGIKAQCGVQGNRDSMTLTFNSVGSSGSTPSWSAVETLSYSSPIGNGCTSLDFCNGRGECDYCLQICQCDDGFGSDSDKLYAIGEYSPTCSDIACPIGMAIQPRLYSSSGARIDPDEGHQQLECSNVGICLRETGTCECIEGFEGPACERQQCPNACSGRGKCRSMRQLALIESAVPLNDYSLNTYRYVSEPGLPASEGWDADSLYQCVCDSSWGVGFGSGETQQAEWFGPDCSLRRCPSGDDPETQVDETDGEGIICDSASVHSSSSGGAAGNLCHVDCSRRGICDHSSGECECFEGYTGANCASTLNSQ